MTETTRSDAPPSRFPERVALIDLDISFGRLVLFFVKASLAMIPAAFIVALVLMLAGALARALFGGFGMWGGWSFMDMHRL
jgi:hypothetical protein